MWGPNYQDYHPPILPSPEAPLPTLVIKIRRKKKNVD